VRFLRARLSLAAFAGLLALVGNPLPAPVAAAASPHAHIDCDEGKATCLEVADSKEVFGPNYYVGHDEPSLLFYSNQPGSGGKSQWLMTLPTDPPPVPKADNSRSWNFQLHPAFWVGMALCDTQSSPNPIDNHVCIPNSDSNITSDAQIAHHAGTAFLELQFYPPGGPLWPPGNSCDATKWCVAFVIWSLGIDYPSGKQLNDACQNLVGVEYPNLAFLTLDGKPQAPPNAVNATLATYTPDPARDLFMNSGDRTLTSIHDTAHGLSIEVKDLTTGQTGSMVASAANGFGQVKFTTNPSTECTNIPYDFHPMYSTSSENTRVPWAAHSYNIAWSDEIGHFDYCSNTLGGGRSCRASLGATEGTVFNSEPAEGRPTTANPTADDTTCFTAAEHSLVPVQGCYGTNTGFDGVPYEHLWPDGNPDHPTSVLISSPMTGHDYQSNYERVAFEADLPRIETVGASAAGTCNRTTGTGCTLIPITDDQNADGSYTTPANFYPYFTAAASGDSCQWTFGANIPGLTTNDYGKNAQYGTLLKLVYPANGGGGATSSRYNDFRQILNGVPCRGQSENGGGGNGGGGN
jgi:hypothetical protein